ncbi:MAG TPA: carboxy-S-adenosyl-L-methionine synthase CmoA [Xanthomonadales bacterium]|nr:carboxy-S-adenosyl-L-methionine synthase CmoA [Xanthomonadales bacterium]
MSDKDRLYQTPVDEVKDFVFDERVVRVFPDMINRSVPGYGLVVAMAGLLARRYAQDNSALYDLGCSLGAVALAMSRAVTSSGARIIAVDNSAAMIARLDELLAADSSVAATPVETLCEDICRVDIEDASVVVLNFTLQFVPPDARLPLLRRIAGGLRPGGILLLSEKVCCEAPREDGLLRQWHHDFKRAQGYSELEISRKRDALENVMRPDSLPAHRKRLLDAGFREVYPWFQALNFLSLVAIR